MNDNQTFTRTVELSIQEPPQSDQAWLLVPRPIDDWTQRFCGVELDGVERVHEVSALNSRQGAYLLKPANDQVPVIRYHLASPQESPGDWIWQLEENRFTKASAQLTSQAIRLQEQGLSQRQIIEYLMQEAAGLFAYDHPQQRFNDGLDEVPAICGTAKGSCVDINTYLIASARSLGIMVQYLAGYWFHPAKGETHDMHCWLAFHVDGETIFWDLAHHLKWGVPILAAGLNPAGGRRVTMSCGRGIRFDTPNSPVTISHFSEPLWVLPDDELKKPSLTVRIAEDAVDSSRQF